MTSERSNSPYRAIIPDASVFAQLERDGASRHWGVLLFSEEGVVFGCKSSLKSLGLEFYAGGTLVGLVASAIDAVKDGIRSRKVGKTLEQVPSRETLLKDPQSFARSYSEMEGIFVQPVIMMADGLISYRRSNNTEVIFFGIDKEHAGYYRQKRKKWMERKQAYCHLVASIVAECTKREVVVKEINYWDNVKPILIALAVIAFIVFAIWINRH